MVKFGDAGGDCQPKSRTAVRVCSVRFDPIERFKDMRKMPLRDAYAGVANLDDDAVANRDEKDPHGPSLPREFYRIVNQVVQKTLDQANVTLDEADSFINVRRQVNIRLACAKPELLTYVLDEIGE